MPSASLVDIGGVGGREVGPHLLRMLASGNPPGVADLVDAFIRSLACHLEPDNHYLAFLSRYFIERGGYAGLEGLGVSTTFPTFLAIFRRLLPDIPDSVLDERWTVMTSSAVHTVARYQSAMNAGALPAPLPDLIDDLVCFLAAGLQAEPPS